MVHKITATKLTLKSHRLWIPEGPHIVRIPSRKHGSTVRRLKSNKIGSNRMHPHERAGIPSLGSTARIHINPIDGYQCSNELRAQLNLTNDQKRRRTTPKACPDDLHMESCHVCNLSSSSTLLSNVEKRMLTWLPTMHVCERKRRPGTAASCSTLTRPTCETWKKGQQFTLLKRITNSKL